MKNIIYILMILALFTSCKKEETKPQSQQQKTTEGQTVLDSVTINDFGEHKGIHQQEWEEHRRERGLDTLRTDVNP